MSYYPPGPAEKPHYAQPVTSYDRYEGATYGPQGGVPYTKGPNHGFAQPAAPAEPMDYGQAAPAPAYSPYTSPDSPHHNSAADESKWTMIAAVIFVLGCFCCPIWLLGALTLKKGNMPRNIGGASLVYACLSCLIGIILLIVLIANGGDCDGKSTKDCLDEFGCGWCTDTQKCTKLTKCSASDWYQTKSRFCDSFDGDDDAKLARCALQTDICKRCHDDDCNSADDDCGINLPHV